MPAQEDPAGLNSSEILGKRSCFELKWPQERGIFQIQVHSQEKQAK